VHSLVDTWKSEDLLLSDVTYAVRMADDPDTLALEGYLYDLPCEPENNECPITPHVSCLREAGGGAYGVLIDACLIESLTDEEIVSLVRGGQSQLHLMDAFDDVAAFLNKGIGEYRLFTRHQLRRRFGYVMDVARDFVRVRSPHWMPLYSRFLPYWNCENPEAGFIYCLSDQLGHYKLGLTRHLDQRISQLRTQPPFEIELVFAFKVLDVCAYERDLHRQYAHCRLRGEWFSLTPKDLQAIAEKAGIQEGS